MIWLLTWPYMPRAVVSTPERSLGLSGTITCLGAVQVSGQRSVLRVGGQGQCSGSVVRVTVWVRVV